jgi:hypothetical protein
MLNYMMKIPENDAKAMALIKYLQTLEFVELKKASDWWGEIGEVNKVSIEKGLDDLNNGRIHNDQDVRNSIRERILKAKKE